MQTSEIARPGSAAGAADVPAVLNAVSLLQGRNVVVLEYQGQSYRLSVTRAGKLILTK